MQLGKNLRKRREEYELTQEDLAKRIGINQASIAYFEADKKIPSLAVVEKIADTLNCSIDYLIGKTDKTA